MMKNTFPDLSKLKVVVVSHIFTSGPTQALVEYLNQQDKAEQLLFIGHPLLPRPGKENISFCYLFQRGKRIKEIFHQNFGPRFSLHYLENCLLTAFWVLKTRQKWDLFIGVNNLNTLSGLILKVLGKVNKVVFYGIDYAPKRFEHPIVNVIYHWVDKVAVFGADEIWLLSFRMIKARAKFKHLRIKRVKVKVVPMGIWFEKIKRTPFEKVKKHQLVFMGHLLKKQGVQMIIKAIPEIVKKIPDFKFLIIGKGEYKSTLERLVKVKRLQKRVIFAGYIKDYQKMARLISQSACAVALYQKGDLERNYTYYADPGKIKDYLGAGLPVILTDVSHNAYEIEKAGCGVVVDYDEKEVIQAVIKVLSNKKKLKDYRKNALKYAKKYDWSKIYKKVFRNLTK